MTEVFKFINISLNSDSFCSLLDSWLPYYLIILITFGNRLREQERKFLLMMNVDITKKELGMQLCTVGMNYEKGKES